jgi:hypothetical protein
VVGRRMVPMPRQWAHVGHAGEVVGWVVMVILVSNPVLAIRSNNRTGAGRFSRYGARHH